MPVTLVSLGDYVLNGGEVAALAMTEAVARLVPGVVGNAESLVEESHEDGLLEYPVYTKPPVWREREVPAVLRSGDHGAVARWRHQQRLERTAVRRPDLLHASAALPVVGGADGLEGLDVAVGTAADAPELLVLQRACWLPEGRLAGDVDIPPMVESLDDVTAGLTGADGARWTTWMLRAGGRLVGSVRGRTADDDPATWETGRLMAAPDLQGRGLGRALLELSERAAPASVRRFWINTGVRSESNLRRYKRAGYRQVPGPGRYPGTVDLTKRR